MLRSHGPVDNRCQGSGQPPRAAAAPSPSSEEESLASGPHPVLTTPPTVGLQPVPKVRVLGRIPKAARSLCCSKFTSILEGVIESNSIPAWNRLFQFTTSCLRVPQRKRRSKRSLTSFVKEQLQHEGQPPIQSFHRVAKGRRKEADPNTALARRVTTKIEEGDFRGAVRLASSADVLADFSDDNYSALKSKHPSPHPDTCIPPPAPTVDTDEGGFDVSTNAIVRAISLMARLEGHAGYVHNA